MFSDPNIEFLLVFFLYGLAFFSMGLVLLLESRRSPLLGEARLLLPLAVFGFVHGAHEWVEMFLQVRVWFDLPELRGASVGRLVLLILSFSFLWVFSIQALRPQGQRWQTRLIYLGTALFVLYLALVVITGVAQRESLVEWILHADAYARYLLAVPAAFLAAQGLYRQSRVSALAARRELAVGLRMAAWSFAAYSLTQMVVSPAEIFPARILNTLAFHEWTGIPVQVVRAAAATLITLGLFRATQAAEAARRDQFAAAQQSRLEALAQIQRNLEEKEELRREHLRITLNAQEEERARIARELHDETAQFLTALTLNLATLRKAIPRSDRTVELLDRLQQLSQQMAQGISRMVRDLRPAQLDDLGLEAALGYLVDDERRRSGLDISLKVSGAPRRMDSPVETVLFRVAQEALTNVARHARTGQSDLQLEYLPDRVALRVQDWGIGFDVHEELKPPRGWGIAGMRERVDSIGGELNLESAPGSGTLVEVLVPFSERQPAALQEEEQ